jgi:hypothetical protein
MTEADWLTGTDFTAHVRFAADHLSPRRQRLLAVGFCRAVCHLIEECPKLTEALAIFDDHADSVAWRTDAERVRQQCRDVAQEAYEEYRTAVDNGIGDGRRGNAWYAFAWAVSFVGVNPVPLADVGIHAAIAAHNARAWASGKQVPSDPLVAFAGASRELFLVMRSVVWEVVGNPFRPVAVTPEWRTDTAVALARQMYESREFGAMPILADALQDAGCDNEDVLNHCRDAGANHVRGCWVVDLVLGK